MKHSVFELAARGSEHILAVLDDAERDFRMALRRVLHHGNHIVRLGKVLFEELHTCRCVVKQVTDNEGCTLRAARRRIFRDLSRLQMQVQTLQCTGLLGHQIHAGDGGNRRECLAAKSERADAFQILLRADFAGRMAAEGNRCVLCAHAAAVVRDAQIGDAAVLQLDGDRSRTCVNRVFDQLLADGRRTLNNLTGCDQIRHMRL